VGHEACKGKPREVYVVVIGKPHMKRPGGLRVKWKNNIEVDHRDRLWKFN
jgi:hypothetical protein